MSFRLLLSAEEDANQYIRIGWSGAARDGNRRACTFSFGMISRAEWHFLTCRVHRKSDGFLE